MGKDAGADMTDCNNVIIIGDGIRSLDRSQKDVVFLQDRVAISKKVWKFMGFDEILES